MALMVDFHLLWMHMLVFLFLFLEPVIAKINTDNAWMAWIVCKMGCSKVAQRLESTTMMCDNHITLDSSQQMANDLLFCLTIKHWSNVVCVDQRFSLSSKHWETQIWRMFVVSLASTSTSTSTETNETAELWEKPLLLKRWNWKPEWDMARFCHEEGICEKNNSGIRGFANHHHPRETPTPWEVFKSNCVNLQFGENRTIE